MTSTIVFIILSLACDGFFFYLTGLYAEWFWWWIPFFAFPILYILWFGISLAILFFASLFINKKKEQKKPNPVARFLTSEIDHQLIFFSRTHVHTLGFDKLPSTGPFMIIYNHTSNFDPMLIMDKMRDNKIICITKPQNENYPIAGAFIHASGFIPINREDNAKGVKAINKAISFVEDGYGSICVAPEGMRSKTLELLPFHPGCFNIAKRTRMPIVAVGFKNTHMIHKNFPLKTTRVEMEILEVVPYDMIENKTTVEISQSMHLIYEQYLGGKSQ